MSTRIEDTLCIDQQSFVYKFLGTPVTVMVGHTGGILYGFSDVALGKIYYTLHASQISLGYWKEISNISFLYRGFHCTETSRRVLGSRIMCRAQSFTGCLILDSFLFTYGTQVFRVPLPTLIARQRYLSGLS